MLFLIADVSGHGLDQGWAHIEGRIPFLPLELHALLAHHREELAFNFWIATDNVIAGGTEIRR